MSAIIVDVVHVYIIQLMEDGLNGGMSIHVRLLVVKE